MRGPKRIIAATVGAGVGLMVCAGTALGQITRAGAVGTINPVPTAGTGTTFRGTSTFHPFPGGPPRHGFKHCSSGFIIPGVRHRSCVRVPPPYYSTAWFYPAYAYPYAYPGWRSTYEGGPLYEIERRVGEDGRTVIVVAEPPVDEALEALRAGRFGAARLMYLDRAEERRSEEAGGEETRVDRTALRLAALAAAGERRYPEADRLFADAYAQDPSLSERPFEGATLVGGTRAMREIVNGAVAYAHKVRTPEAWRMVAWLMQGEGRHDRARAMMARAEEIAERVEAPAPVVDPDRLAAAER